MKILNIAAGKIKPLDIPTESNFSTRLPKQIVNVDTTYYQHTDPAKIEEELQKVLRLGEVKEWYCKEDAFRFMENTRIIFDRVVIYRFLEHISFTQVNYFLYLVSTVLKKDGLMDVIVPNYEILARMLLNENIDANFEAHNILLTTELLNEPSCPHASIWTWERVKYFVELEGRFKVESLNPEFSFDDRDIYIRFIARRI